MALHRRQKSLHLCATEYKGPTMLRSNEETGWLNVAIELSKAATNFASDTISSPSCMKKHYMLSSVAIPDTGDLTCIAHMRL